jgi:hypothetical protein
MEKILLSTALFFFAPFIMVFALIGILVTHQHMSREATQDVLGTNTVAYAALPTSQNTMAGDIAQEDGRKEKVRQFLAKHNSPMEAYAGDIVDAADLYGLDHRLIPAIAMQESNVCKKIPVNSHNCWGYGIYGKKVTRFADYKEGIYTVTKGLATRYKPKGLVTPEQIMTMYTPSSNGSWAFSVRHFMAELE